jgi:hypothetical protein
VKRYEKYGRKVSWNVKWYVKYGGKASRIVIGYGQYGKNGKLNKWKEMKNMEKTQVE